MKMKKMFSSVLAGLLALSMVASIAYVEAPEKAGKSQLDLVSIKAVDVQNSVTGIRAYTDIVDTTRAYQVNDVIYIATTVAVKNIALSDYKNLDSIKNKNLDLVVGSQDIDLSFSKASNPVILSAIYSGYSDSNIGLIGVPGVAAAAAEVISIQSIVNYNKDKNEATVTFKGRELNTTSAIEYLNIGASITADGKVSIPALRSTTNKNVTFKIGSQKYSYTYDAPKEVQYTLILTGVTKDNAGKTQGDYYAKLMIKSAEEFVHFGSYMIDYNSQLITDADVTANKYVEYVDYITVNVKKLEIAGGYNVYKYVVPSSGLVNDIQIRYIGDAAVADEATRILAWVNPAKWDYNTGKSPKTHNPDVAGSVNAERAYNGNQAGTGTTPTTSLVYTTDKTYYAPYYYNGIALKNVDDASAGNRTVVVEDLLNGAKAVTFNNNTITVPMAVGSIDGYVARFSDINTVTAQQVFNNLSNITINRTPTTLQPYTKSWEGALADYIAEYDTLEEVAAVLLTGPTVSGTVTDSAIQKVVDAYNLANWPSVGDTVSHGQVLSYLDASGATPSAIAAVLTNNAAFKAKYDSYFITKTATIDPTFVKEGKLPQDLLNDAINIIFDASSTVVGYGAFEVNILDSAAAVSTVPTATVTAVAAPVVTIPTGLLAMPTLMLATDSATYAAGTDDIGLTAADQVGVVTGAPDTANGIAVTAAKLPIAAANATGANVVQSIPANLAEGKNKFWAYNWSYLPAGVLSAAEAQVSYVKTNNATGNQAEIAIVILPSTANTTAAVAEKWTVQVTYNGTTRAATADSASSNVKDVLVSGFFSPTNVNLNLPADTKFDLYSALDLNDPAVAAAQAAGTGVWALAANSGLASALVPNNFSRDAVFGYGKVKEGTDLNDYTLWTSKNTDGTIARVGFLFNVNSAGNESAWAGILQDVVNLKNIVATYYTNGTAARGTAVGLHADVVDNNGINVYTITEPTNDRPVISVATEWTNFKGDDGYGIALFENKHAFTVSSLTTDNKINNMIINRVYRANNENFGNVYTGGYASTSADMIAAIKFFGLDASFGTTYKLIDSDFNKKGAAAVYTEEVTGKFTYGVITVVEDLVDEATEEEDIVEPDPIEETPEPDPVETVEVPPTGDASANVAIALAVSAMIAAAGLTFIMKKRSN